VDRKALQELSKVRLKEAKALLGLELWDGAYYLAGYAVECAIKACIAKATRRFEFPEREKVKSSYSHNLRALIGVADLEKARLEQADRDADFRRNWQTVQSWTEQSRYEPHSAESAREILEAVGNKRHGVISWIKHYW
jgi:HEPN domain-containing protein